MRQKRNYCVLTFHTTSAAMAMEQFCAAQSVGGRLIPVPRELSAGCGLAWRMLPEEFPALDRFWADETRRQLSVGDFRIDIEEIAVLSL